LPLNVELKKHAFKNVEVRRGERYYFFLFLVS
jgi:hypothetical protein